jgi:hypothetical protein
VDEDEVGVVERGVGPYTALDAGRAMKLIWVVVVVALFADDRLFLEAG